jgi:hypothetical protein
MITKEGKKERWTINYYDEGVTIKEVNVAIKNKVQIARSKLY